MHSSKDERPNSHNLHEILLEIENMIRANGKFSTTIGKEEIIAIAPVGKSEAAGMQTQLRRMIKGFIFEASQEAQISFSYGHASFPQDGASGRDILKKADENTAEEAQVQKQQNILVVDDEPTLVEGLRHWLNRGGYKNIATATDGQEALEKIDQSVPDLILLDMRMPRMSGYEVIGRLKQNAKTQSIPILIISAYEVETEKFRQYTTNAIPSISKPVNMELLQKWVEYLL